jgi:hypothetical protein
LAYDDVCRGETNTINFKLTMTQLSFVRTIVCAIEYFRSAQATPQTNRSLP